MIKKILVGMGIAFAILFLGVFGLITYLKMNRDDRPDSEIVARSLSPNGSIQLSVERVDFFNGQNQVYGARYYLLFETPNRVFPQRSRVFYANVTIREDCEESLSVQWKDNLTLEIQNLATLNDENSFPIDKYFDGKVIEITRAPRIRTANCP